MLWLAKYILAHLKQVSIVVAGGVLIGIICSQVWSRQSVSAGNIAETFDTNTLSEKEAPTKNSPEPLLEDDIKALSSDLPKQVSGSLKKKASSPAKVYADIKGAVTKPGMYQIVQNERILDLVKSAGGFTKEADQTQLNFAEIVEDQGVIYVPKIGEEIPEDYRQNKQVVATTSSMEKSSGDDSESQSAEINLNEADIAVLQSISGIGPKKAEAIIKYRQEHGSFQSVDELKNVTGIGAGIITKLKEIVSV